MCGTDMWVCTVARRLSWHVCVCSERALHRWSVRHVYPDADQHPDEYSNADEYADTDCNADAGSK